VVGSGIGGESELEARTAFLDRSARQRGLCSVWSISKESSECIGRCLVIGVEKARSEEWDASGCDELRRVLNTASFDSGGV
jgi:hypothetical protein